MGNNFGKWDSHYAETTEPFPYGDTDSYRLGYEWLQDCTTVEDWGCGKGWFKTVAEEHNHSFKLTSLDGSQSPFADKQVDFEDYRSDVHGIFMRHVLEHNFEWEKILANMLASARRIFLAIFTPMSEDGTEVLTLVEGYDNIPDLSLPRTRIDQMILEAGFSCQTNSIRSPTIYGEETLYRIIK